MPEYPLILEKPNQGFSKTVSDDLKSILLDVKSFSPTNLKYMRYFYEMYPDAVICPQVEDELITDANRPQVGDDLQIIFRIPWGHNKRGMRPYEAVVLLGKQLS